MGLKNGERATCWLFVPPNAVDLNVEWKSAPGAPSLTVEGGWKVAPVAPTTPGATGATRIEINGRAGWQRFAFAAQNDLLWSGARFEKANTANAPGVAASGSATPRR
jgi:hypothetical protein